MTFSHIKPFLLIFSFQHKYFIESKQESNGMHKFDLDNINSELSVNNDTNNKHETQNDK